MASGFLGVNRVARGAEDCSVGERLVEVPFLVPEVRDSDRQFHQPSAWRLMLVQSGIGPSALVRNDSTLLAKSDLPARRVGRCSAADKSVIWPFGRCCADWSCAPGGRSFCRNMQVPPGTSGSYAPSARMTEKHPDAFGVDDTAGPICCPVANRVLRVGQFR